MTRRVQVAVTMRRAWPREATPRPRSGAEVGRTPRLKGGGREELRQVRGRGGPGGAIPCLRPGAPEGLEELFHFQGQEGR